MHMKTFLMAITAALMIGLAGLPAIGQTQRSKQEEQTAKVKKKIAEFGSGPKARIKVRLYNDTTYKGYVESSTADDFKIVDSAGGRQVVRYSDVRSLNGKNLST